MPLVVRYSHAEDTDEAGAGQNAGAMKCFMQIERSIIELLDGDLLDLAYIFRGKPETAIAQYAFAEMARRQIRL